MPFGPLELIVVLAIILLLFGVGRISKLGGEVGSAIANFRQGVNNQEDEQAETS